MNEESAIIVIENYMNSFRPEKCGKDKAYKIPAGNIIIPFLESVINSIYAAGDSFGVRIDFEHLNNLSFSIKYDGNHFRRVRIHFNGIDSLDIVDTDSVKESIDDLHVVTNEIKYDLSLSNSTYVKNKYMDETLHRDNEKINRKINAKSTVNTMIQGGNLIGSNTQSLNRSENYKLTERLNDEFNREEPLDLYVDFEGYSHDFDTIDHSVVYNNQFVLKSIVNKGNNSEDTILVGYRDFDKEDIVDIDSNRKVVELSFTEKRKILAETSPNLGLYLKK